VSWRGTIAQYAGRLHRLSDGKREVQIYDYADLGGPMLARMFDRRCRGYEAIGYTVLLPASAIPGWPVDVILPADPVWKRDYAGSVQRLVRDGVDRPLASLFLHATRTVHVDAEGADRARSATEAFLFRRLETLAETKGRFRLNEGCRSRSMPAVPSRRICSAPTRAWRSSWTAHSILPMRMRIAATGARTGCCRRTVTSSCASWPRT
jgi:hypothetical protein